MEYLCDLTGSVRSEDAARGILMASSSVPTVFAPRKIGKYRLVDGGTNNLPVDLLIAAGEDCVIAVDIGTEYEAPDDRSMIEVATHSFSIMSRELKDCRSSGERLLLKPRLRAGAGLLNFSCMEDCMEQGYHHTKENMGKIKKVLSNKIIIKDGKIP